MATTTFDPAPLSMSNPTSVIKSPAYTALPPDGQQQQQSLGLKAIYTACCELYPDQLTPLQVTAVRKYWMGGPDPLDFINIYSNPGSIDLNSPPHWHYVTNGLSDLYGDARLHGSSTSMDDPSGFGFELTLRIRRRPNEHNPPTWPAHLLQSLARYVFHSQAQLMLGDHIPWPTPLDKQPYTPPTDCPESYSTKTSCSGASSSGSSTMNPQSIAIAAATAATSLLAANNADGANTSALHNPSTYASIVAAALAAVKSASEASSIEQQADTNKIKTNTLDCLIHHMLVVEDPQLRRITTPYGYVQFLQLVGLCEEELRLVQRWMGNLVADLMRRRSETGGRLLVTDMDRRLTVFELETGLHQFVKHQLEREGSNLSGVTTRYFAWGPINLTTLMEPIPDERSSQYNQFRDQTKNDSLTHEAQLPKDLSMQNTCDDSMSDVAMETDDTVVSAALKKETDDNFVDVVGDDEPCSGSDDNKQTLVTFPSTDSLTQRSKQRLGEIVSPHQPASAPGKFSAWCDRLLPQYSTAIENEHDTTDDRNMEESCTRPDFKITPQSSDSKPNQPNYLPTNLISPTIGAFSFRTFAGPTDSFCPPAPCSIGSHTPGSVGGDSSAPCTPLAHLSLSPASLDLMPSRVVDCLDVHFCSEVAEMLPLAVTGRLRHGKHFTFLNAHYPDHAITLVPSGMPGAFVTETNPYVARGPWLQVLLPNDFLDILESEFSILKSTREITFPLVFRWPDRRLRICLIDSVPNPTAARVAPGGAANALLPKALALSASHGSYNRTGNNPPSSNYDSMNSRTMLEPSFPYFPSGFVPPPEWLATLFQTSSNCGQTKPSPMSAGHPGGSVKVPTFGGISWIHPNDLSHLASGSKIDPHLSVTISEDMRAAMQHYLGESSGLPHHNVTKK